MKKILFLLGNFLILTTFLFALVYREGLTSNPIGQFTGFQINHQQAGWGTSLYYPKINPQAQFTKDVKVAIIDSGISKEAVRIPLSSLYTSEDLEVICNKDRRNTALLDYS
ncbi:hypothetical protein [Enterococcus columbae]|uniref:Uncharacterized protein n=1 Tax=Enterococcus columbae DSM 7374 = ATCC 51263 TaxID=1121865 RepID=S0KU72_9ENTE|nr:hypothetical protein [Enterococcus columbae]EOT44545.1 hypothetical protein OMW_00601 [Enterococcus columbae DSM 7374 = ATCC 51263]EOW84703.1 hypothetical protein I568_01199 [Enterococcus columbae DSM 7374 = ATCC 51263]